MSSPALFTAMTGLKATSYRQEILSNNVANANTTGFRSQLSAVEATPFEGPPSTEGMANVVTRNAGYSQSQGPIEKTGSPWNVALDGQGWLVTQDDDGNRGLTRDGRLQQGPDGFVRASSNGDLVLGANMNPINLPDLDNVEIGRDGAISGVPAGQGSRQAQQFNQLFIAQTPDGYMSRKGDTQFAVPDGADPLVRAEGTNLQQGYLEKSDVNPVKAMTDLIAGTRSFQVNTRLVKSTQQASSGLNTLISKG